MNPSLLDKVLATINTRWRQFRCHHTTWIRDRYKTNGKRTCHCKQCWKTQNEDSFAYKMARNEYYEEWIERAMQGGMTLKAAIEFWNENLQFD